MLVLKLNTHQANQTNLARRLPIHTNKVGSQPKDHWGLNTIQIN